MSRECILILGASGQLGTALREVFADKHVIAPPHEQLDIEDEFLPGEFENVLMRDNPHVVINCAALHDAPLCDRESERAFAVNALGVESMAKECAERGIDFATVSTDYVLDDDGNESPLNKYGESKLAGERLALAYPRTHVFRTSGLYGKSGRSNKGLAFIERVLQAAEKGETFRAVGDVAFSPSYAPHVAHAMRRIIEAREYGLHNAAGTGSATWFEFAAYARWYAFYKGRNSAMGALELISIDDLGETIRRPRRTCLGDGTLPDWRVGVSEYVDQRIARKAA